MPSQIKNSDLKNPESETILGYIVQLESTLNRMENVTDSIAETLIGGGEREGNVTSEKPSVMQQLRDLNNRADRIYRTTKSVHNVISGPQIIQTMMVGAAEGTHFDDVMNHGTVARDPERLKEHMKRTHTGTKPGPRIEDF